jgi:hypothetical protein
VKIAALVCGILASAIAWVASYFVIDLGVEFMSLWPETISQQFLGLVTWHVFVALALVGGMLAVFSPISGAILLLLTAAGWAYLGTRLPAGFSPQLIAPLVLTVLGALAAIGATLRGVARRRARDRREPDLEEVEREEALRFEPTEDLARAVEVRSRPAMAEERIAPATDLPDAIVPVATRRPEGPPPATSGLVLANALMLLLLTIGVAVLLYADFRNGSLADAFSTLPFASSRSASAAPALAAETPSPDGSTLTASVTTPAIAENQGADAEVRITSQPLDIASLDPDHWSDPFAYCKAVGTVDYPDQRYSGPHLTEAIAAALRVPVTSSPDRVKWRCDGGALLGCTSFRGSSCALTPSVTEMLEYCAQNPNAQGLLAPNGSWSCNETEPEIPAGQSWPVDSRGFLPGAWVEISPPPETAAG